jgi:hypothetical protein
VSRLPAGAVILRPKIGVGFIGGLAAGLGRSLRALLLGFRGQVPTLRQLRSQLVATGLVRGQCRFRPQGLGKVSPFFLLRGYAINDINAVLWFKRALTA